MKGKEFTDKIKKRLEALLEGKYYWQQAEEKSIKTRVPVSDHGNKTDIDIAVKLTGLPFSLVNSRKTSFFLAIEVKYRRGKGWIEIRKGNPYQVVKVKELQRKKRLGPVSYHPHIEKNYTRQLQCYADQCPDLIGFVTNMPIKPYSPYHFSIAGYHHPNVLAIAILNRNLPVLLRKMEGMFEVESRVLEANSQDLSVGVEVREQ